MNLVEGETCLPDILHVDEDRVTRNADQIAGELFPPVLRFGEADLRLMPLPVLEVAEAGQRPVDPRRANLQPVGPLDRVRPVEQIGKPPDQLRRASGRERGGPTLY